MFKEVGERMTKNPTELPPPWMKIKVVAPPESQYSVRMEGLSCFFHIPADVDFEVGVRWIWRRKCF